MRLFSFATGVFLATSCIASAAQAEDCGPLKRAISLDLQTGAAGLRMMVPVTINGVPKHFLLDTGGSFTSLSRETANQMNLTVKTGHTAIYDMYGGVGNGAYATVDIGIGPIVVKQFDSLILPPPWSMDGIFAPDLMNNYDIDLDFAGRKLNYFLTDHCEGHVVYWPASATAVVPFRGWAISQGGDTHMTIPVTIDGHQIIATVDTGSTNTTLNADSARALFGLSPDSPGAIPMGTMDGNPAHKVFGWVFKKLEIGDISVSNARITVIPNLVGKKGQDALSADSRLQRITDYSEPDMLLGMDVLTKLHVYIAFKERKLYVTAAPTNLATVVASNVSNQPASNAPNANESAATAQHPPSIIAVSSGALVKVSQHDHYTSQLGDVPPSITIISQPAHGKVSVQSEKTPVTNRSSGETQIVTMTQVFYQSEPGYVGTDSFTYKRISSDPSDSLNANTYAMTLDVK